MRKKENRRVGCRMDYYEIFKWLIMCVCVFVYLQVSKNTNDCVYRIVYMSVSHSREPSAILLRAKWEREHLAVSQRCIAPQRAFSLEST